MSLKNLDEFLEQRRVCVQCGKPIHEHSLMDLRFCTSRQSEEAERARLEKGLATWNLKGSAK